MLSNFSNYLNDCDTYVYMYTLVTNKLPWPSDYELRLLLERLRVLILIKVIGGRQEGHRFKNAHYSSKSPN